MPRALLWFAYEGRRFDGYARQPDPALRTVEAAVLDACVDRGVIQDPASARLRSGSRTDRGVSARRNALVLDAMLPADRVAPTLGPTVPGLWPLSSVAVPDDFDPRWASSRTYRYVVPPGLVPDGTSVEDLRAAGAPFVGRHDFRAFARLEPGKDPMRTVSVLDVSAQGGLFVIEVQGPSFLWRQVRRMVSAMVAVCRGEADTGTIRSALADPAGAPDLGQVPAAPLVLWDVVYPNVAPPSPGGAHLRRLGEEASAARAATCAEAAMLESLLAGFAGPNGP